MKYQKFACALLAVGILLTAAGCEQGENGSGKKSAAVSELIPEIRERTPSEQSEADENAKDAAKTVAEVVTTAKKTTDAKKTTKDNDASKKATVQISKESFENVYLKAAKCSVVLQNVANTNYISVITYVPVGEYVFVFGSSNVFKANCNGKLIAVSEAYEKGYLTKDELKKLYDNFPSDRKMPLMQYLLAEKSTGERREFKTATEKNPNGTVLVTLSTAVSKKYQLTPADFAALGINNIAKVTSYTWPNEANEQLSLTLKEPGVDKVNQLIEQLSGLSGVVSARPDTYIYLD